MILIAHLISIVAIFKPINNDVYLNGKRIDYETLINNDTTQNDVLQIVDKPAKPTGGYSEFYNYIKYNLKYPRLARVNKVEGEVYVKFIVEKDGSLSNIEVARGIGYGCDEEVVRLIENSKKWLPAQHNNQLVRQSLIIPVSFKLWGKAENHDESISSQPQFPEGSDAYNDYLKNNLKTIDSEIPPNSFRNVVKIQFEVDSTGALSNFKILQSLSEQHDKEVLRVFKNMPTWEPGTWKDINTKSVLSRNISFDPYSKPDYEDAYQIFYQGNLKFHKRKYDKAKKLYTEAISIVKTELDFYFLRAKCNVALGNVSDAYEDLEKIKSNNKEALLLYETTCN